MEEKFLELLEKAKQNGTQASVVLIEIEQLLHSDNEEIQELLEKAKQNGTQATTILLEIEQILGGEDEELLALFEKAKQNGSQAVTVLTDIVETRGVPQPIPVHGDVQIFADSQCTKYANTLTEPIDTVYVRINKPWVGNNSGWTQQKGDDSNNVFNAISPSTEYPNDPYCFNVFVDFLSDDRQSPFEPGEVVEAKLSRPYNVSGYDCIFSNPNS